MRVCVAQNGVSGSNIESHCTGTHERLNPCAIEVAWDYALYPRHKFGFYTLGFNRRHTNFISHSFLTIPFANKQGDITELQEHTILCPLSTVFYFHALLDQRYGRKA
jgi:hypothetical protein